MDSIQYDELETRRPNNGAKHSPQNFWVMRFVVHRIVADEFGRRWRPIAQLDTLYSNMHAI